MKTLIETLANYIAACFSGLWIETFEPDEAIREIETLCHGENWNMTVWDISQGDPLSAIASATGNGETPQLVVLRNYHRFLNSIEIIQAMERQIQNGKVSRTFFIVLAPVVQIPVELEKLFQVVEHPLPDKEQLRQIATEIAGELPDEPNTRRVLDAAAGMTRLEAEGAFSLSMIEQDMLLPEPIWQLKANMLRQSSALRLYRGEIPCLGGLNNLTTFCNRALSVGGNGERAKGGVFIGIYSDSFDYGELGNVRIRRASHVEPTDNGRWTADLSPVDGPVLGPFDKRSEALDAELEFLNLMLSEAEIDQV